MKQEIDLAQVFTAPGLDLFAGLPREATAIRDLMRKDEVPTARKGWTAVESAQWRAMYPDLPDHPPTHPCTQRCFPSRTWLEDECRKTVNES